MALWPFGRKSVRKRSRSGAALSDSEGLSSRGRAEAPASKVTSQKQTKTEPAKLQRRPRTYSFSPGRADAIRVERQRRGPPTKLSLAVSDTTPEGKGEYAWGRTPTLYHKSSDLHPSRRKSSKRRRDDHEREAEIKAMSAHMPPRSNTEHWATDALRRPSTKRPKPNKTDRSAAHWDRPTSNVSLPLPDSLHSSLSSDSDHVSYKISGLGSLAPRPTLRYAPGLRQTSTRGSNNGRPGSPKKHIREHDSTPKESSHSRRRIEDLADDLDASELRELMERDSRRRERQRSHDQARMERRLARKAEKQTADASEARKSGSPPPENLERGVMGRELVGLGLDPASAVVTSSTPRQSPTPEPMVGVEESSRVPVPLDSFHRMETIPREEPADLEEKTHRRIEPVEPVSALPQGSRLSGLLRTKKSRSKSTLGSDKERSNFSDDNNVHRKDSDASNKGSRRSLTSFLRWGQKNKRNSGPSSFSNTSREEMQAAAAAQTQAQAQAEALAKLQGDDIPPSERHTTQPFANSPMVNKPGTTAPKRTRSRFREDLPDFPLSPPDSRVQSPEAEPPLPSVAERSVTDETRPVPIAQNNASALRHDFIDDSASPERLSGLPSPDPHLSISLASIDSEASWLSGRVANRRSGAMRDLVRANRQGRPQSIDSLTNSTQEDLAITSDDYLSRLTPGQDVNSAAQPRPSGEGRPSSDEEESMHEGNVTWGAVGARPHFVHVDRQDRGTMHSQSGLLNMESDDENNSDAASSGRNEDATLERAQSVSISKRHIRNFSAGSARLLDLTPRNSVESPRVSKDLLRNNAASK